MIYVQANRKPNSAVVSRMKSHPTLPMMWMLCPIELTTFILSSKKVKR